METSFGVANADLTWRLFTLTVGFQFPRTVKPIRIQTDEEFLASLNNIKKS